MNKKQALHDFWSKFGWKAYEASSVPDNAELPYILHETSTSEFDRPISLSATLCDRSTSWSNISDKELEISGIINRGGVIVPYTGGAMWITKGLPWSINLPAEEDNSIRKIMLNYNIEFFD